MPILVRLLSGAMALLGFGAAAVAQHIDLLSPRDFQVFQRDSIQSGHIIVEARAADPNAALQYRLLGKSLTGDSPADWKPLTVPDPAKFKIALPAPAGGWYRLEIQMAGHTLATVDHVGVGEVFVVAGQSNSTNYGSDRQTVHSGLVVNFDGAAWGIADDPQPGVQDRSNKGSFIPAFGDTLAARLGVPIGIACVGCGSTSVRQWLPKGHKIDVHPTTNAFVKELAPGQWESTGQLYDGLLKRVAALGPHGFRALLWHQGESDAGQARAGYPDRQITADQYRQLMEELIRDSRRDAGWDFPWVIALATYHSPADPFDADFRAAQKSLWDSKLANPGPDTDALTGDLRAGVHFNARGLQAHGNAWVRSVELLPQLSATSNSKPEGAHP